MLGSMIIATICVSVIVGCSMAIGFLIIKWLFIDKREDKKENENEQSNSEGNR